MSAQKYYIGLDVGSISIKGALLKPDGTVDDTVYQRHFGQPLDSVVSYLQKLIREIGTDSVSALSITGSAGNIIAELLGAEYINEVISVTRGIGTLHPKYRTVIEMGGEDSKFISLNPSLGSRPAVLEDFSMNSACAAGTGSFLDQQAKRLEIDIENEFGSLALQSKTPPRIAGRCSVFAKSDMIHLQQIGTPDYDIVAGLCFAVARNFHSTIAKGKQFRTPVAFVGGVASNAGMVRAFREILELDESQFEVPAHHKCLGAIGAAMIGMECAEAGIQIDINKLLDYNTASRKKVSKLEKLTLDLSQVISPEITGNGKYDAESKIPAFIGIDIGSVSTNVVVIDRDQYMLARRYLPTAGRPIEAVKKGLREIGEEIGDRLDVRGVGTTGSGRYMISDLVGADIVRNEITAQAKGAISYDPAVDTIFEIGGQDSKYISIENGVVVNFAMNKVCAAGTGSFIEEQAERLNLNIKNEFADLASSCDLPVKLGERCTVFIESDLIAQQQAGANKDELVSGLAYSIARNYLNRVVDKGWIGNNIFFQGGTANNKAVVAAFEKILNKKITVPPHNDVLGAIGIAILAKESAGTEQSRWKGFGFVDQDYKLTSFVCKSCSNLCEIKRVKIETEKPLFYGSRCERFDYDKKMKKGAGLPDLFEQREKLLLGPYYDKGEEGKGTARKRKNEDELPARKPGEIRVGIPRLLQFHENFPFWRTFFESLGWTIILSERTTREIIHKGCELVTGEFCFPVKVAHGHFENLLKKDIDYLFLPSLINHKQDDDKYSNSYNCPYVQAIPYILKGAVDYSGADCTLLEPHILLQRGRKYLEKELKHVLKPSDVSVSSINKAIDAAEIAQQNFRNALLDIGKETLEKLESGEYDRCLLIVGRSYNTCDDGLNLDLPRKLRDLGVLAVPMDCLPVEESEMWRFFPNTYWKYGQRLLGAGNALKKFRDLYGVYITNFGCGPDSMVTHLFKDVLGDQPYLQLEIDEHSADAGIMTRCEAFLDSLEAVSGRTFNDKPTVPNLNLQKGTMLYLPKMCNHAYPMAAAFRGSGLSAEVLPEPTDDSAELGRRFTNGKECFPCIVTMGDIISKVSSPDFDRKSSAFFMPTASGPCRFGQYSTLNRLALRDIGYDDVPVFSPGSHDSYTSFGEEIATAFRRTAWKGLVIVDAMEKMLREVRPYEESHGESESIFESYLHEICRVLEKDGDIFPVLEEYRDKMSAIQLGSVNTPVSIGVVGEIYLRLNQYSNSNVVKRLEELGVEVRLAPMNEWILYTNRQYIRNSFELGKFRDFFTGHLKNYVQVKDEHRIMAPFKKNLRYNFDPPVNKILNYSKPYMHFSFGGEAILTVGKAIDYAKQGVSGIVNVSPFTCMPGVVVSSLSDNIREDLDGIPWLNLFYDGQQDEVSVRTRLETFVYQAREFEPLNRR